MIVSEEPNGKVNEKENTAGDKETKKERKPKKQKPVYIDDGHTVYSMENLPSVARKKKKDEGVNVTKKERRAMIKAAYLYYLPRLLLAIACFAGVAVLLWLWLK